MNIRRLKLSDNNQNERQVFIMNKTFKKIMASITAFAALTISVSSLCVNAVSDTDSVMTSNHGTLTGYIDASKSSGVKYVFGSTTVAKANPPYISCAVDVDKYPSGVLIDCLPVDYSNSTCVYVSGDSHHWNGYTGAISIFGAHEYRGTNAVVCYTAITNFS